VGSRPLATFDAAINPANGREGRSQPKPVEQLEIATKLTKTPMNAQRLEGDSDRPAK
jgi:hypothetical protein